MAKAVGIGGVFLRSTDPQALGAWYTQFLDVDAGTPPWMQASGPTVFAPFPSDSDYFPQDRPFMLNFRVDDLDALIAVFEAAGVDVLTDPAWDSEIGRFARVHDPDGNPVELWQPMGRAAG